MALLWRSHWASFSGCGLEFCLVNGHGRAREGDAMKSEDNDDRESAERYARVFNLDPDCRAKVELRQ